MESCNHDSNDIENPALPLVVSMKEELETLSPISSVCCIYGVSERLRLANERAHTPQVVSIGPLHHGKESLKAMEEHKKRYLRDFLRRTNLSLENYIDIIKSKEARLRSSYAEPIEFGSDEFVKMVHVDAAFVVELPFFVLEDLLATVASGDSKRLSITELSLKFFIGLLDFDGEFANLESMIHVLEANLKTLTIPSVSELIQSGVRIKPGSKDVDLFVKHGIVESKLGDSVELFVKNSIPTTAPLGTLGRQT
ncbi:hypothetical protein TIFTF001_014351 [Ficus carica]|uniref:Uncharacterized protein n=1 Tax=Ficus carica TaxID=3494 RepID=A0AA87ZZD3_FICCA|nr:hypothetical protein TIFTF001_014351 [Ficus carica]